MNIFFPYLFLVLVLFFDLSIESSYSELAKEGEYPHQVLIKRKGRKWYGKSKFDRSCGGSLINSNTVITAAHCLVFLLFNTLDERTEVHEFETYELEVLIGSTSIFDDKEMSSIYEVEDFVYPVDHLRSSKYRIVNNDTLLIQCESNADIALIQLKEEVFENGDTIRYVEIDPSPSILPGTTVFLAGWGMTEDKKDEVEDLRKIEIPIQPPEKCLKCVSSGSRQYYHHKCPYGERNTDCGKFHLCAGDGKREACKGDSGGALVRLRDGENSQRWSLVGVTSFQGKEGKKKKGEGFVCGKGYSAFNSISTQMDWILKHTTLPNFDNHPLPPLQAAKEIYSRTIWKCFGVSHLNMSFVCSGGGQGECTGLDTCECKKSKEFVYEGEDCSIVTKKDEGEETKSGEERTGNSRNIFVVVVLLVMNCCLMIIVVVVRFGELFRKKKRSKVNHEVGLNL